MFLFINQTTSLFLPSTVFLLLTKTKTKINIYLLNCGQIKVEIHVRFILHSLYPKYTFGISTSRPSHLDFNSQNFLASMLGNSESWSPYISKFPRLGNTGLEWYSELKFEKYELILGAFSVMSKSQDGTYNYQSLYDILKSKWGLN